jgi:hypothetical protein
MRRDMLGGEGGLRGQPARFEPGVGCCFCRGVEYVSESERNSAIRRCLIWGQYKARLPLPARCDIDSSSCYCEWEIACAGLCFCGSRSNHLSDAAKADLRAALPRVSLHL